MLRIQAQNEDDRKIARSALIWVTNAKRPLKLPEITAALAIKPGDRQFDRDNVPNIEIILAVCAGLVIFDENLNVVRLVHYTTQEYFDSIQDQQFPNAQTEITRILLTFLAFDELPGLLSRDLPSWHGSPVPWRAHLPALLDYSQYCLEHAAGQPEVPLRNMILKFIGQVAA
jgi:hypothetical protein